MFYQFAMVSLVSVGVLESWSSGKLWICCRAELGNLQAATEVRTRTVLHPEQKVTQLPHPLKLSPSSFFSSLHGATFSITLLPAVIRLYYTSSPLALSKSEFEQCTVCRNCFALDLFCSTHYGTVCIHSTRAVLQTVNFLGTERKHLSYNIHLSLYESSLYPFYFVFYFSLLYPVTIC